MYNYPPKEIIISYFCTLACEITINMAYRVKEICKEKGLTMKELAGKLEISEVALRKSLAGNPTIGTLTKIADALGVNVVELIAPVDSVKVTCPHCGKPIILNISQ